ncbi:MAG: 50S ribosomal protein L30 [Treponema sp.]|jgi:large subunit ribosomal protein L30|nr:50S ribosomal protein L30 [Treponema sp.]
MVKKVKVRLIRSLSGSLPKQRATVRCLGLRKIGTAREHKATPAIEGMIRIVSHMVSVEEVSTS